MSSSNSNSGVSAKGAGASVDPPRTAREILDRGREFLNSKGVEEFRLDAELLVAHVLKLNRLGLFLELDRPIDDEEIGVARELLVRRGKGEPVAYLTGSREFYGRSFSVGSGCLIPRPETEHLVDEARRWALERTGRSVEQRDLVLEEARALAREVGSDDLEKDVSGVFSSGKLPAEVANFAPVVLDIGTGSGCLAISLALELENANVVAVERSELALHWAQKNAQELEAAVQFVKADGFDYLAGLESSSLDLVVSNPPYVDPADAPGLAREVRDFEPAEALFAPKDDLDLWVRELVNRIPALLRPGGLLLVELGMGQGERALKYAQTASNPAISAELIKDLAGIERLLALRVAAVD